MTMCTKKAYGSRAEAQEVLQRAIALAKRGRKAGKSWKRLNEYLCDHCGLWHLGRSSQPYKPPKRKGPTAGELKRDFLTIVKRLTERDMRINGRLPNP